MGYVRVVTYSYYKKEGEYKAMAKTKTSVRGEQTKKIVPVHGYTKSNGVKVKPHRRSTPD